MQADVSLVGWPAPAAAMTDRAAAGPSLDDTADDATLVAAALAGSDAAFDLLVTRHRRAVYQVCYRFVHHHEDAADLTQDTFMRAWRALASFRGQAPLLDLAAPHRRQRLPQQGGGADAAGRAD